MHAFPANLWMRLPRPPARALAILEFLLWAALAVQAVRLVLLFVAPAGPVGVSPDASLPRPVAPLARSGDPFGPRAGQAIAQAPLEGLVLHGVRVGESGGAAIISHDGRQRAYRVGDAIVPGVTLEAVGPGVATMRTSDGMQRLELARGTPAARRAALPSGRPATPAAAPATGDDPLRLMQQSGLQPEAGGGYRVGAGAGAAQLQQAGLQTGDVVTAVDGKPLSPDRLRALQAGEAVELTVRRDGRTQSIRIGGTE